jgi:hypothetical protein
MGYPEEVVRHRVEKALALVDMSGYGDRVSTT